MLQFKARCNNIINKCITLLCMLSRFFSNILNVFFVSETPKHLSIVPISSGMKQASGRKSKNCCKIVRLCRNVLGSSFMRSNDAFLERRPCKIYWCTTLSSSASSHSVLILDTYSKDVFLPYKSCHRSNSVIRYYNVLSTMGVSKESISKFLIGNRFHVKLRILSPYSNRIYL